MNRDTRTKINISEVKDSAAAHGLMTQQARFPRVRIGARVTRQLEAGAANLTVLIFGPRVEGDTEVIKDFWNTAETSKSTAPKPREGGGR